MDTDLENITNVTQEASESDPYAYLNRDFSSENFKIEVKNLPKFYGHSEFRKLLNEKLKLNSNKQKTPKKNCPYAFVCFRNEEDRLRALEVLDGYKWKGKALQVLKAKPAPDPLVRKRTNTSEDSSKKKAKLEDIDIEESIRKSTIPLSGMPYEDQLVQKQGSISSLLKKLCNEMSLANPEIKDWLDSQRLRFDGLPCELEDIRYASDYDEYRNKCEFTVGAATNTNLAAVGFRIGSYVNGSVGVGPVDNLRHVPGKMKKVCKVFEKYVQSSNLQVFDPECQTGSFRQLTARCANDQLLLIVGIHPQNLNEEELSKLKSDLVNYFSKGEGTEANVTSLYYQNIIKKQCNDDQSIPQHLWGDTHIFETLLDLKFKISPQAFFQINTAAAQILYEAAISLAAPCEESIVLDVCCGTGTIGLCFSKKCKQVLGIELVGQAVLDARENANINNITNAEFFEGKAEDLLGTVCYKAGQSDVIAVVDPPRAGLHQKAILQLRKISKIKKLIYISCNPEAAFKNFIDLTRPESKTLNGEPFVPVKAVCVDMFPHTKLCELIICFKRWDEISKDNL